VIKKNIILIGKMGAGKDFIADWLVREYGYRKIGLADAVKGIFRDLFLRSPDKKIKEDRISLQKIGDFGRSFDKDIWCKIAGSSINGKSIVIKDCRFPNEAEYFNNFIKIKIDVSEEVRSKRLLKRDGFIDNDAMKHDSETEVDNVKCDLTINLDNDFEIPENLSKLLTEIKNDTTL
jgi:dephospho-CoA kinase